MDDNDLAANAVYVIVSDGAPTAGRFELAAPRGTMGTGPGYIFWDDRVDCQMTDCNPEEEPSETNCKRTTQPMVSRLYDEARPPTGGAFAAGTFYETAMERPQPNEGVSEEHDFTGASWYEYLQDSVVACSNDHLSCRQVINKFNEGAEAAFPYALVSRLKECVKDVSFNTHLHPAATQGPQSAAGITTWLGLDSLKWVGNVPDDSEEWWNKLGEGYKYRQLFYDCSLAAADAIRKAGGTIYVIAIGHAAPAFADEDTGKIDPYQDISDRFRRKDCADRRIR